MAQQPQGDPWAEAAKSYKPQAGSAAPQNEDWKLWQSGDDATPQDDHTKNGFWKSAGNASGVSGLVHAFAHPIDTAMALPGALLDEGKRVKDQLGEAWNTPNDEPMHAIDRTFYATPFVGSSFKNMDEQAANGNYKGAAGSAAGTVGALLAGPEIAKAGVAKLSKVAGLGERAAGYVSPVIDPTLQTGSKIAKSIGSAGGITPTLEGDLGANAPLIKAFAEKSGNPLHSQWEFSQAAKGSANEGLARWNQILDQYGGEASPIDAKPVGGWDDAAGRVKVGDAPTVNPQAINKRIAEINNLLRPASNAKSSGATMTALERSGLTDELSSLRSQLYGEMSQRTGIEPLAIKNLREGFGQQFGIADAIDQSRRMRLGQMGQAAEGASTIPTSKTGLLEKAFTSLRGGREYLANANMRDSLKNVPSTPPAYPEPVLPTGDKLFMGATTPKRVPIWAQESK